jgi:hypothetical protein
MEIFVSQLSVSVRCAWLCVSYFSCCWLPWSRCLAWRQCPLKNSIQKKFFNLFGTQNSHAARERFYFWSFFINFYTREFRAVWLWVLPSPLASGARLSCSFHAGGFHAGDLGDVISQGPGRPGLRSHTIKDFRVKTPVRSPLPSSVPHLCQAPLLAALASAKLCQALPSSLKDSKTSKL